MTWPASGAGHRRWAEAVHVGKQEAKVPACPAEGWLGDGRQVLHFKPVVWDRWRQELEVTSGEWLSDEPAPLLKRRQQLSRQQALELWRQRRSEGWAPCAPQWQPPQPPRHVFWR
ncbi:MAG: DUF1651 domain-containing protein [Vulcanococcus sp.]|nr:DUF1651 domain-containing protein [Vulcanococcus sp.]